VPLSVGVAAFLVMALALGRKRPSRLCRALDHDHGGRVALHRSGTSFLERNALIMRGRVRRLADARRAGWAFMGALRVFPRNLILVEVVHPKSPISMTIAIT